MNGHSSRLNNDIDKFEEVIRNLSIGVNNSGIYWRDSKFEQLAGKIGIIAASSKSVIEAGKRCESALRRFESLSSEV